DPIAAEFFGALTDGSFWADWSIAAVQALQAFFVGLGVLALLITIIVARVRRAHSKVEPARIAGASRRIAGASSAHAHRVVGDETPPAGAATSRGQAAPPRREVAAIPDAVVEQVRGPALGLIWTAVLNW